MNDDIGDRWAELDEALSGPDPDWETEPEAPANAYRANGLLRTLGTLRRRLAEDEDMARAEHERIELWLTAQRQRAAKRITWLEQALELWHAAMLAQDPSRKTLMLPSGNLESREMPDVWTFEPSEFIPWAEANRPDLLRRKPAPDPEIDRNAVKKAKLVDAPGVKVQAQPTKFTAKPGI